MDSKGRELAQPDLHRALIRKAAARLSHSQFRGTSPIDILAAASARIPTASRFVSPRWLRWVPPTTALFQRRTTKRLYFWAGPPIGRSDRSRAAAARRLCDPETLLV